MRLISCVMPLVFVACSSTKPFIKATPTNGDEIKMEVSDNKSTNNSKTFSLPEKKKSPKAETSPGEAIKKANQDASRKPRSDGFFNAAMVFDWEPHSLYQIYAAPFRVTDIAMEPTEKIISISGGDTTRWQVAQTSSGSGMSQTQHIIVKPLRSSIETNLIVMTDRRSYHLEIHSLDDHYMASVRWNFPQPLLIDAPTEKSDSPVSPKSPAQLDFGYHFVTKNKPAWMPKRVFDDGQKTFIEFPHAVASREMPGLFVLSKSGAAEIINYRAVGNFFIIDRLIDLVELRLGGDAPETVGIERL